MIRTRLACTSRLALLLFALLMAPLAQAADAEPIRVVYHLDDSARAIPAIRNITNHLKAAVDTQIVLVALGHGVDVLIKGAKDDHGNPYEPMVDDLLLAGVEFRVCNNTLVARQIAREQVLPDVAIVESGVAEIARLQAREHYVYLKP